MATARPCLAQLSRQCLYKPSSLVRPTSVRFLTTTIPLAKGHKEPIRSKKPPPVSVSTNKYKKKAEQTALARKKKRKVSTMYPEPNMKDVEMFSLLDAMRYIRAFEVGREPTSVKYDLAIRLRSPKNGPIVRNRLRLPHPVKTDIKICVICPPDSKYAQEAKAAGAYLVGEDEIFEQIKEGKVDFERCLCQFDSLAKMNKAGVARILGPKGLMPSTKTGTVVKDPAALIKDFTGGAEYKERMGVVRMAIGQLGFTPEAMAKNITIMLASVKRDTAHLSDKVSKEVIEVVLSSTNAPGFPLSGNISNPASPITSKDLQVFT